MVADLTLENVRVYDVERFGVRKGQKFHVKLTEGARWFSDQDKVLDITTNFKGDRATIVAENVGKSVVRLYVHGVLAKVLKIGVYEPNVSSLNISFGKPELK